MEIFNKTIELTTDKAHFLSQHGIKINYSQLPFDPSAFHLLPYPLLFENDIRQQSISCRTSDGLKIFFENEEGDFPFDILAAIFYLLSRYEEYLPHQKDAYGRYAHQSSLAFREKFLHLPLINLWLEEFKNYLRDKFPDQYFHRKTFRYIPTYDIDLAWKYKNKGWSRNTGGCLTAVMKGNWSAFNERIAVVTNKQKDPYEAYEWLDALHLYCRMKPYYFFLLAENVKGYDRNISPANRQLQQLIAYQALRARVGIHPSWQSGDDRKLLKEEIGWLEFITGDSIRNSRQHYIRFELPRTFRELIGAGIERDFSMGYGTINGFRASVASAFNWYDLEKEESTNLRIYPFCFMDANAYFEEKLSAQQAFAELMQYYHVVKKVNGLLITIWHNNFLGSEKEFKAWKEIYEIFLKEEVYWDS